MADVYGDQTGFVAYWTARGDGVMMAQEPDAVNIALLIASEWLDGAFGSSFSGVKAGDRDQVREWPRHDVTDKNGDAVPSTSVPREVIQAVYEAAAEHLRSPGVFFKNYTPGKYKSVSITGALSVDYRNGNAIDFQTQFAKINAVLAPLLCGKGAVSSLSGSIVRV